MHIPHAITEEETAKLAECVAADIEDSERQSDAQKLAQKMFAIWSAEALQCLEAPNAEALQHAATELDSAAGVAGYWDAPKRDALQRAAAWVRAVLALTE